MSENEENMGKYMGTYVGKYMGKYVGKYMGEKTHTHTHIYIYVYRKVSDLMICKVVNRAHKHGRLASLLLHHFAYLYQHNSVINIYQYMVRSP